MDVFKLKAEVKIETNVGKLNLKLKLRLIKVKIIDYHKSLTFIDITEALEDYFTQHGVYILTS